MFGGLFSVKGEKTRSINTLARVRVNYFIYVFGLNAGWRGWAVKCARILQIILNGRLNFGVWLFDALTVSLVKVFEPATAFFVHSQQTLLNYVWCTCTQRVVEDGVGWTGLSLMANGGGADTIHGVQRLIGLTSEATSLESIPARNWIKLFSSEAISVLGSSASASAIPSRNSFQLDEFVGALCLTSGRLRVVAGEEE